MIVLLRLRDVMCMNRMDGKNNESTYKKFDMFSRGEGASWEVQHCEIIWLPEENR